MKKLNDGNPWFIQLFEECRMWLNEDSISPEFWTPEYKAFRDKLDRAINNDGLGWNRRAKERP